MNQNFHPKYRPDIDGLRAIAILSVVIFHAFPSTLKGGFVGVDIFFVISGYLISSIIFKELQAGNFKFLRFYARRVRRIFPALIVVLTASLVFGWYGLLAGELRLLGKHAAASTGFLLNFELVRGTVYFDNSSDLKPLLHLWSLSIEEQFYLVFPLFVWAIWRGSNSILFSLIAAGILSFGLNIFFVETHAAGTFFLLHSRMWELLAGGLLAHINLTKAPTLFVSNGMKENKSDTTIGMPAIAKMSTLSIAGFCAIILAVIFINRDSSFPGWLALLPVLGTVALIQSGPNAWINRKILANRFLVTIGLFSYPLYLWHWPILSFLRIVESETPAIWTRCLGLVAAFFLAWVTWQVIEKPIRGRKVTVFETSTLISLLLILGFLGSLIYFQNGFPDRKIQVGYGNRLPDSTHKVFFEHINDNYFPCEPEDIRNKSESHLGFTRCAQSRLDIEPTIALIGDSHGEHLFIGLADAFIENENVVYYSFRCLPFLDWVGHPHCKHMNETLNFILSSPQIHTVVIAASWPGKILDTNLRPANVPPASNSRQQFEFGLRKTLHRLAAQGKRVFVIGDTPSFSFTPIRCIERRPFGISRTPRCTKPSAEYIAEHQKSWDQIRWAVDQVPQASFVSTEKFLCDSDFCDMRVDDQLMFRDNDHLSVEGSIHVGSEVAAAIKVFKSNK